MNPKNSSINLKELSYLTGFSVSTVSKALNDKFDISDKTKRFITGIAEKHNYIPNSFAVGLRNKKSCTVAIILPQINVDFFSNMLFYFQNTADRNGYRIIVFQSFELELKEIEYLNSICDGSIDGAIVITSIKNNVYSNNFSIPVMALSIMEALATEELDNYCFNNFDLLLNKIA